MNSNIIFDTNIFIYQIKGSLDVNKYIFNNDIFYSVITKIELLGYFNLEEHEEQKIKTVLNKCKPIYILDEIIDEAIRFRRKYQIKLGDSIILASASIYSASLLTNDIDLKKKIKDIEIINPF